MKNPIQISCRARKHSKALLLVALSLFLVPSAEAQNASPSIEFSTGLVGSQVRLSWVAEPGVQYKIEKSSDLSGGGWQQVSLVEATSATGVWMDPEKTTGKSFYRITLPQPEVFSLEPPVISAVGGEILIRGQLLPPGSFLVIEIDGQLFSFALVPVVGQPGVWRAVIGAGAIGGITGGVVAGRTVDSNGVTICPINQSIQISQNGFALDGPPGPPPSPPTTDAGSPVKGVGVVIKKNPGSSGERIIGNTAVMDIDDSDSFTSARQAINTNVMDIDDSDSFASARQAINTNVMDIDDSDSFTSAKHAINTKGMGCNDRCSNGVTGEVTLQVCPISLDCPAGPAVSCDLTYRSMVSTGISSSFGPGWTFGYDISVTRIDASHVEVFDGGGRADIFTLQTDGSYTCDGMFRTGSFDGDIFTLTFADRGKWVFRPLDTAPGAGKISSIRDRNNVALTCDYAPDGQLSAVSSAFGQSLSFTYGPTGEITRVTDHTGRFCDFSYSSGFLSSVSCPRENGQPPVAGPTSFTYSSGFSDSRLNGNLLSCRDGAGRLIGAFTYSSQTDQRAVDYDCVVSSRCSDSSAVPSATTSYTAVSGGILVCDCDELGRLTETLCDRQYRPVQVRDFTGFCVAGTPVTPSSNRPTGKLRSTDPDFYQTSCSYNSQHCPVLVTEPDGLQTRCTYDWDLAKGKGLALQRGNLRVCTLRPPGGEERTVSMTYQPGFGASESPGCAKGKHFTGQLFETGHGHLRTIGGCIKNPLSQASAQPRIGEWAIGIATRPMTNFDSAHERLAGTVHFVDDWQGETAYLDNIIHKRLAARNFRTSLTTTLGQKFTTSYDAAGNAIACRTPISGAGCDMTYNSLGQPTSVTTLNGPTSSFTDEFSYDASSKFCTSVTTDPAGLHLTESCVRDTLGRVTSVTDARGFDTLFSYNALDLCDWSQSPLTGSSRIKTSFFYDGGGLLSTSEVEQRDATGALSATNPTYATIYLRESPSRPFAVSRLAVENRPVDDMPPGSTDLTGNVANFDICDFTFDACGQLLETRSPAASLAQPVDQVCSYQYDERGLLYRCIEGGLTATNSVTTQCDYTSACDLARCATLGASPAESPTEIYTYDGFRRCISTTDAMGNVEICSYDNQGYVTCSLFGELDDVSGSAGNVLLSRTKGHDLICGDTDHFKTKPTGHINIGTIGHVDHGRTNKTGHVTLNRREIQPPPSPFTCDHAINTKGAGANDRMANNKHPDLMKRCINPFLDVCIEDDITTVDRFTPGSAVAPVQEITTCDYSPAGLLLGVSTNGDSLLACAYDTAGRKNQCADGTCAISLTLDACDNVTACVRTDFSSVGGASKSFTTSAVYDALGRCTQTTEGGNTTACDFDSLDRLTRCAPPSGAAMLYDYDGGTAVAPYSVRTRCDVDGTGTLQTLGSIYSRAHGRKVHGPPKPAPQFTFRSYSRAHGRRVDTTSTDSKGYSRARPRNIREVFYSNTTPFARSTTNSNGATTTITCDSQGRCVRTDFPDGTFETCSFDALGRPTVQTRQDGSAIFPSFDLKGRCYSQTALDAGATNQIMTRLNYNGFDSCTQIQQGIACGAHCSSNVQRTFDSLGNLLSESQNGHLVSHTYSHRGRTSTTYPGGSRFYENRDSLGRLISCTADGATGPAIVSFEYLGSSVSKDTRANGVVTTFTFRGDGDAAIPGSGADFSFDACVQSITTSPLGTVLSRDTFTRNRSQDLIRRETAFSGEASTVSPLRRQVYSYDGLHRVTRMQTLVRTTPGTAPVSESDVSYTLDLEGKRLTAAGGSNPGSYTSSDIKPPGDFQMSQYTTWPGGSLEWDENGNLTTFSHGAAPAIAHRLRYDVHSRLVAVENSATGDTLASFGYDACDRLISRTLPAAVGLPSATTFFIYDGERCIQELGNDGQPDMTFAALGHCISTRNGTIYYPHGGGGIQDAMRQSVSVGMGMMPHVKLLTSANGIPFERFDCDDACKPIFLTSEGAVRQGAEESLSGFKWMAPEAFRDRVSGLYFHRDGTYSPDLGQDISCKIKLEVTETKKNYVGHVTLIKQ